MFVNCKFRATCIVTIPRGQWVNWFPSIYISELNPKAKEEQEVKRRQILESFRTAPFEDIVAKSEAKVFPYISWHYFCCFPVKKVTMKAESFMFLWRIVSVYCARQWYHPCVTALAIMPSHQQNTHDFADGRKNMNDIFDNYVCSASHMRLGLHFQNV